LIVGSRDEERRGVAVGVFLRERRHVPPAGPGTEISVEEPPRPSRVRRRSDLIRLLVALAVLGLVLLLPAIAHQTTTGIQSDIRRGTSRTPHFVLSPANLVSTFGVLAVPVAFGVAGLIRRDRTRIMVGVLAAVLALGVTLGLDAWVRTAPQSLAQYLAWTGRTEATRDPLHLDLTPVIAYVTAIRPAGRPRWQFAVWTVVGLSAPAALAAGYASPLALAFTYLVGRAVGHATLYAAGAPNPRPPGTAVIAALRRMNLRPVGGRRVCDGPEGTRRYVVTLADSSMLDVTVLDRDLQVAGLTYRLWRRIRLRSGSPRRALRSLRRSLEQESLTAYAMMAAGVRTPRLVATSEVGTDAALLAYEHVSGLPFDALPAAEITEDLLRAVWRQLRLLQANRLAHRRLEGTSILVADDGRPYLIDPRSGEIAAGEVVLRLDLAQLLVTVALRAGPERAVRTAREVLGAESLAAAVPLLQKVALSRETRHALGRSGELLTEIREQILLLIPETEVAPVRLERFRPRTLVTIIGGTAAAYFLLSQLSNVDFARLARADWRWTALGLLAAGLSHVAASWMLLGFVPERLSLWRTVLVQLTGSFIKLVAPAAVTGVAVNTRYLQKSGIRAAQAVSSVGASQLTGFGVHILLLLFLGFVTGSAGTESITPSRTVVSGVLVVALILIAMAAVGPVRRLAIGRLRPLFDGVVPRLLDVLQSPRKILTGLGGTLMLTACFVTCLDSSIRAFGGSLSWTAVAVVFMTCNALGSAAPTPGGLGAVEAALTAGLTLAGLPGQTALSAVLLFRIFTFWLPVLPGWAAFTHLQRTEAI
jgi:uncharacterized membrane protein YbhN (UPF0104 family)/predicted Ser/Thr protein kinase